MVDETLAPLAEGLIDGGLLIFAAPALGVIWLLLTAASASSVRHAGIAWREPHRNTRSWLMWSALAFLAVAASVALLLAITVLAWRGLVS